MTTAEQDFSAWAVEWQETEPEGTELRELRARIGWHQLRSILGLSAPLAMLTAYSAATWSRPEPFVVASLAFVWIAVVASVAFQAWNMRGTWRAEYKSVRTFAELSRRQLHRRLRALAFGWGLLGVELAFFVPWIPWVVRNRDGEVTASSLVRPYAFLAAVVTVFVVCSTWIKYRARRQLAEIEGFLEES